jgi:hypothetical protein
MTHRLLTAYYTTSCFRLYQISSTIVVTVLTCIGNMTVFSQSDIPAVAGVYSMTFMANKASKRLINILQNYNEILNYNVI